MKRLSFLLAILLTAFAAPADAAQFERVGPYSAGGAQAWWWNLEIKAHVPESAKGRAGPVVLLLHGCGQNGQTFAAETGWRDLSEKRGFALVVAEFKDAVAGVEGKSCMWWFDEELRAGTESNLTGRLREALINTREAYGILSGENFVVGLSAGAAMGLVVMTAYPDEFAAGASMAGIPAGCARVTVNKGGSFFMTPELRRAFGCMEGPAGIDPADWAKEAARIRPNRASWPRLSIWQGDSDPTVACVNAVEMAAQWAGLHGAELPSFSDCSGIGRNPAPFNPVWVASKGAQTLVEMRIIPGFGHAAPIDPKSGCGAEAEHAKPAGVCAAAEIADFFGIQ